MSDTDPLKIISGGQSGVDRAALDVALGAGIPCGGWCPRGRLAEDGPIAARYPLRETPSQRYPERTRWNVRDADATLILTAGPADRGTGLTIELARRLERPFLHVDLDQDPDPRDVDAFIERHGVGVLNVAGPRESRCPGIGARVAGFLRRVRCFSPLASSRR
jgi:hypothetical protein